MALASGVEPPFSVRTDELLNGALQPSYSTPEHFGLFASDRWTWVRGLGLNQRPSAYETDELPLLYSAIMGDISRDVTCILVMLVIIALSMAALPQRLQLPELFSLSITRQHGGCPQMGDSWRPKSDLNWQLPAWQAGALTVWTIGPHEFDLSLKL